MPWYKEPRKYTNNECKDNGKNEQEMNITTNIYKPEHIPSLNTQNKVTIINSVRPNCAVCYAWSESALNHWTPP